MAKSGKSKKVGTKEVTIEGIDIPLTGSSMVPVEEQEPEVADFRVIDAAITREVVEVLRGHFAASLCYTIPRRSSKGKLTWPECDLAYCKYKGKEKHIHINGIGYQGAIEALQVYPGLIADIEEPPTIVEEAGRMFWRCKASCLDTKTGSRISRYHVTPVMEMWGGKVQENEFAALVVQSKALRNVILAMIPAALKESWVAEFKRGAKSFSAPPEEKKSLPPAAKDKPKDKPKKKPPVSAEAKKEFAAAVKQIAPKLVVPEEALLEFAKADFDTPAQATLWFVGATDNENKLNGLKAKFTNWSNQKKQEEEAEKAAEAEKKEKSEAEEPEMEMEGPDQPSLEGVPGGDESK